MGSGDAKTDTGTASDAMAGYNPCPAKGGAPDGGTVPCAIMALGDSITDGAGGTGGSYRWSLFHLALSHQQNITFVGSGMNGPNMVDGVMFPKGHEGHSGYTIDDGGGRTGIHTLTPIAMNNYHPHIITLMIGTNDIDIQLDVANAPMRLGGLLDTIIATDPKVLIVLAQMVPTTDDAENVRVKAYNDAMPALVRTRADAGKHVILVDMYGGFQANANYKTEYMNDKLHPKDPGYVKMADIWYAAIGPLFR
jgi:lysophospholipase L1-like esterase